MQIQQYLANSGNYNISNRTSIKYIVIHYTGNSNDTALNNCKYFSTGARNASAHYFVDDSNIYQSVLDKDVAWHCGANTYYHAECRNNNSIGIEMCNSVNGVPDKIKDNVRELVQYLMKKYDIIEDHIVRHYDITKKRCPLPLLDDSKWLEFRKYIATETSKDNDYTKAVQTLVDKGIISSPSVWLNLTFTQDNVKSLIKKIANKI